MIYKRPAQDLISISFIYKIDNAYNYQLLENTK